MIPYIHKKTGKRYLLLAHAVECTNSVNGMPVVVYCPDDDHHTIFVRDTEEFEAKFDIDLGKK